MPRRSLLSNSDHERRPKRHTIKGVTRNRSTAIGRMAGAIVATAVLATACSSERASTSTERSTPKPAWSAWKPEVERDVAPSDVAPLCLRFEGAVSGTYTEYVSPDGAEAVAVFELTGDPAAIAKLSDVYRRLGECADETLLIESISETSGAVAWKVQTVAEGQTGAAEFVGFAADADRARIVTGLQATWTRLGEDAWLL